MSELNYSIVTVVKNNVNGIEKTIKSVLSQKGISYEYIVIDGLSTDGTIEIIKKYDSKLTFVSKKDSGLYEALNYGVKLSKGKYICIIHSDDEYTSNNVLRKQLDFLQTNLLDGCYSNFNIYNGKLLFRSWRFVVKKINKYKSFLIPHPTLVLKNEIFSKIQYNTKYKISSDLDFIIRLFDQTNINLSHFDIFTIKAQQGGLSTSFKNIINRYKGDFIILKIYFPYHWILILIFKIVVKFNNFLYKSDTKKI